MSNIFILVLILSFIFFVDLNSNCDINFSKSSLDGTAISAAPVGVSALLSATKSAIVKSISWPTALIIGVLHSYIALATISSLNAHKSSIEPPPLPTINVSKL